MPSVLKRLLRQQKTVISSQTVFALIEISSKLPPVQKRPTQPFFYKTLNWFWAPKYYELNIRDK